MYFWPKKRPQAAYGPSITSAANASTSSIMDKRSKSKNDHLKLWKILFQQCWGQDDAFGVSWYVLIQGHGN